MKPQFPKLAAYQTRNKPGFVVFPALHRGRAGWSLGGSDRRADSEPGNLKLLKPKAERRQQDVMRKGGRPSDLRARNGERVLSSIKAQRERMVAPEGQVLY